MNAISLPVPHPSVDWCERDDLRKFIELNVLYACYVRYHGNSKEAPDWVRKYHAQYEETGELPFFAKRVLGLL